MDPDSYGDMLKAVQAFHDKHDFKNTGGEEAGSRGAVTGRRRMAGTNSSGLPLQLARCCHAT